MGQQAPLGLMQRLRAGVRAAKAVVVAWRAFNDVAPVIIFSHPKSGSTSVANALSRAGCVPVKLHFLAEDPLMRMSEYRDCGLSPPFHSFLERQVQKRLAKRLRVRFITLIRDPIATAVSSVFQAPELAHVKQRDVTGYHEAAIIQFFRLVERGPMWWFDKELLPVTGVDLRTSGFDKKAGAERYETDLADVLIIRTERLDDHAETLSRFVGVPLRLTRENVRSKTRAGAIYGEVLSRLRLPREHVERIYADPLVQATFSDLERVRLAAKWSSLTDDKAVRASL